MICKEYDELSSIDKSIYIGQLVHAVQNNSDYFKMGKDLIEIAIKEGLYANVAFHPSEYSRNDTHEKFDYE